jgi:hypothetical protein
MRTRYLWKVVTCLDGQVADPEKSGAGEEGLYTIGRQNGAVLAPLMGKPVGGTQGQEVVPIKLVQIHFERKLALNRRFRVPTEYSCYKQTVRGHNPQDSFGLQRPMTFGEQLGDLIQEDMFKNVLSQNPIY